MQRLIRSAALSFFLLLLASCGGGAQGNQTSGGTIVAAPSPGTPGAVDPAYENLIQQLYIGYFGRPADAAGLASQVQAFSAAKAPTTIGGLNDAYPINSSVRTLVDNLANSVESDQLYNTGSNLGRGLVYAMYDNLFSREPDSAGADYWAGQLKDGHVPRSGAILAMLASVKGGDAELIARKVRVAAQFTHALDAAGQRAIYDGQVAHLIAQAMIRSADTVAAVREQLRPFDSAILIGRVPVATSNGAPRLDVYRLPACPLLQVDATGEVSSFSWAGIDPRCKNGLVISILRGQSPSTESGDIARKLDQMIAYHKGSSVMNSSWARRLRYIEAAWLGGPDAHQAGQLDA